MSRRNQATLVLSYWKERALIAGHQIDPTTTVHCTTPGRPREIRPRSLLDFNNNPVPEGGSWHSTAFGSGAKTGGGGFTEH